MDFYAISDETLRLSLLTLVHRAAPRPPGSTTAFSLDCVSTARSALEKHLNCVSIIKRNDNAYLPMYFQWYVTVPSQAHLSTIYRLKNGNR